ncbi:MAG: MFS transporter [Jiangellaceae bacterium]|nr:MFS transporter [Jiangellaceae bacterium]
MTEERVAGVLGHAHRRLTVGIVATIVFIAFEAMAVATAMPKAVPALSGMPLYALAFSGFFTTSLYGMVLSGQVCDRRGPRLPYVGGTALFTVGLLIAGTAQSMWWFIVGRAVQGLGGGIVIVAIYVLVGRAYDDKLRPRAFAALSAAWVVPSIVGPLVAGALADHLSWRLVFLGIAPLAVVPVVIALPSVRRYDGPPVTGPREQRSRSWPAFAAAAGMGILQVAGTRADPDGLWLAAAALMLLVPSVPRLLPAGTLTFRRGLPTVVAMRGVLAGAFFGAEAFLPLMLVQQRGLSTTLAGLALTGGALGWAAGAWFQGRPGLRISRVALVRRGAVFVAAGIVGASTVLIHGVPVVVAGMAWVIGASGMGLAFATVGVLLFEFSLPEEQGANSASLQLSDALFSITLIGLGGVIFALSHDRSGTAGPAVFTVIFAVMAAVAGFGAWVSGRLRPVPTGRGNAEPAAVVDVKDTK